MKTSISASDESLNITLSINVSDLLKASEHPIDKQRGRPLSLSPEDQRLFRILLSIGASIDDTCNALNIGRASYFKYKKRLKGEVQ